MLFQLDAKANVNPSLSVLIKSPIIQLITHSANKGVLPKLLEAT